MTVSSSDLELLLATLREEVADPRAGLYGPGSISWRVNREAAILLGGGRAALLQLAHPFVAHAIDQHSATQHDPIGRFRRTFQNVFAMVFGDLEHAIGSARRVHAVHTKIRGAIDEHVGPFARGDRYQANDEDALFWVQATLVDTALQVYELVVRPLKPEERERYYLESRRFARLFGIPDAAMPPDYRGFSAYMERMLKSPTLTVGRPALAMRHFLFQPPRPIHTPMAAWYRTFTAGLLPERMRDQFELPFGRVERAVYSSSIPAIRLGLRAIPRRIRYFPDYVEARRRIRGQEPRDRVGRALEKLALEALRPSPEVLERERLRRAG
jgi:uncharacterized protein (DUF2236 family)